METSLPPRPNLDHLRRQAKSLLAALAAGNREAAEAMLQHLPAARGMSPEQVLAGRFRLADAQSAVARKTGFAGWPQLARHVEQLRALEGVWEFERLEVDGSLVPAAAISASRLLIDGDRFRSESPEAVYEGVFNIDVESDPHGIDIEFVAGPEAGNWNYGIFRLDGERLHLCLDMNGGDRPTAFRTSPGTGHALETLRHASRARPDSVTGGTAPASASGADAGTGVEADHAAGFEYRPSGTLDLLQGAWAAERVVLDGQELPPMMLRTGARSAKAHEVRISFGGRLMIHAQVRLDEGADPVQIDYLHLCGAHTGGVSLGIMRWDGPVACFCMAAPGQPRPTEFACPAGSGRTLSHWRRNE
ncbi:MAG: TIGR03067 domain-containing protein [Phycisphaerales bacterium]|nr:TIGR03067 domain-containing protein [Phycisphaerales bacterium]